MIAGRDSRDTAGTQPGHYYSKKKTCPGRPGQKTPYTREELSFDLLTPMLAEFLFAL